MKRLFAETLPKVLLPRSTPEKRGESSVPLPQAGPSLLAAAVSADQGKPEDIVPVSGNMIECHRKDQALLLGILNDLNEKNPQTGINLQKIEDSSIRVTIFLNAKKKTQLYLSAKGKERVIDFNEIPSDGEKSYMPAIRLGVVLDEVANPKRPEYRSKVSKFAADTYRTITTTAFLESQGFSPADAGHDVSPDYKEIAESSGVPRQATASTLQFTTDRQAKNWIPVDHSAAEKITGNLVKWSVEQEIMPDVEAIIHRKDSKNLRYGEANELIFDQFPKSVKLLGLKYDSKEKTFIITPYDANKNPHPDEMPMKYAPKLLDKLSQALKEHLQFVHWAQSDAAGLTTYYRTDAKNVTADTYTKLQASATRNDRHFAVRELFDGALDFEECEPEIHGTKAILSQPPPPKEASSRPAFTDLWSKDPPPLRQTAKGKEKAPPPQQGFGDFSGGRSRSSSSSSSSRGRD